MTDPTLPPADDIAAVIDRLTAGDRSAALAFIALMSMCGGVVASSAPTETPGPGA